MKNYHTETSLIKKLMQENELHTEQAIQVLEVVSEFAKEKIPMLRGNIQAFVQSELKLIKQEA